MDARSLLTRIVEMAPPNPQSIAALELGETEWPAMESREAAPEDAETCRLLALCGVATRNDRAADMWRDRARTKGEAVGWPELVAVLDMSEAFKALWVLNEGFRRGTTLDVIEGSVEALKLIRALEPVASGPDSGIRVSNQSPSTALLRRFLREKTGSFELALGRWDQAAESFANAVRAAEGPRGILKSRGGLALANYCRARESDDESGIESAKAETLAVAIQSEEHGERDVEATARHNAQVMARIGSDLLLYEIL